MDDRYSGLKFQNSSSSFDVEKSEGGTLQQVSNDLHDLLKSHDAADPSTLQILWDLDIWSVPNLRSATPEQLTMAGMNKFKVTKLKGIVDGKLDGNTSHSFSRGERMDRGSFSFNVPRYDQPAGPGEPPQVGQNEKSKIGSFSFQPTEDDRNSGPTPRQFGGHRRVQRKSQQQNQARDSRDSFSTYNSRDSQDYGRFAQQQQQRTSYMSSYSQGPTQESYSQGPPQASRQQRESTSSSQASFSFMPQTQAMPPSTSPYQQRNSMNSFNGGGLGNGGSVIDDAAMGPSPLMYEDKDPTTQKGSDATLALDSLNNMWQVLETHDDDEKKPVFKADPSDPTINQPLQGQNGGSGLNVKMVDHHAPPSREVIDQLEEALDGDDEDDGGVQPEDLMRLAHRLIALKQYDAALPYTMRAAKRFERKRGLHDMQTMLAVMLSAKLLRRLSHFEKAIEYFALLLDIQEKILGTDHADTANTASALGQLYAASGSPGCDLDRAATCFQQVLHIREKLVEIETENNGGYQDNASPVVQIHLAGCAMALHHLGVVHSDLFKYEEALGYFMRALKIRRSLGDSAEKDTASTLNNMAAVLHQLDRNEQCLAVYARSLEIKKKLLPPTHPSIADTLYNMGALNLEIDRPYEASEFFIEALTISTTKLGLHHPLTIDLQKQILTCDQLIAQQGGARLGDVHISRDSDNGFRQMNNSFVMNTYGDQRGSMTSDSRGGSFYTGGQTQTSNEGGSFYTGRPSTTGGSFYQPSNGGSFYTEQPPNNGQYNEQRQSVGSMNNSFFNGQQPPNNGQQPPNNGQYNEQRQSVGSMNNSFFNGQQPPNNGQQPPNNGQYNEQSQRLSQSSVPLSTKKGSSGSHDSVMHLPRTPSNNSAVDAAEPHGAYEEDVNEERGSTSSNGGNVIPQRIRTGSSDNDSVASHRSLGGEARVVESVRMEGLAVNN